MPWMDNKTCWYRNKKAFSGLLSSLGAVNISCITLSCVTPRKYKGLYGNVTTVYVEKKCVLEILVFVEILSSMFMCCLCFRDILEPFQSDVGEF